MSASIPKKTIQRANKTSQTSIFESAESAPHSSRRPLGWLQRWVTLPRQLSDRLGPTELRRRIWHVAPGFLPFFLWPFPHRDPLSPTMMTIIVSIVLLLSLKITLQYGRIQREGETNKLGAIAGYSGSILVTLFLFRGAPELSFVVLAVLAFGDGAATFGGMVFRGPALPWNPEKTYSGLLSFLICGAPMATLVYWGEAQPSVSLGIAAVCATVATLVAGLAESLPSRINDNIRVGLSAAVAVVLTHGCVVGWS